MGVLENLFPRSTTSENDFLDTLVVLTDVPIKLTQFCYSPYYLDEYTVRYEFYFRERVSFS